MTTTQTTTGRGMFGRWAAAAVLAASLGAGMAASAAAESPRARSAPARTDVQRVFPQRNNTQLVDFYRGGRWVMRVDVSQPGWIYELRADVLALAPLSWVRYPANAPVSFATVQYLLPNRQWVTLPQLQALQAASRGQGQPSAGQGRVYAGQEGTLGGFGSGSSGPSSPLYSSVLGGVTAASQRNAQQQALHGLNSTFEQRSIDRTLAPTCDPHYMRCQ